MMNPIYFDRVLYRNGVRKYLADINPTYISITLLVCDEAYNIPYQHRSPLVQTSHSPIYKNGPSVQNKAIFKVGTV